MATIAGLFDQLEGANTALEALKHSGFGMSDISVVAPEGIPYHDLENLSIVVDHGETGNDQDGILVTVIAEGDQITKAEQLMRQAGSINVETRYSVWERGDLHDYEDAIGRDREKRAKGNIE